MGASSPEEIAAQHAEATRMVDMNLPCAPRRFLGPISLADKARPVFEQTQLQGEEKKEEGFLENPYCFTTRGEVDVSQLQEMIQNGYHAERTTTDSTEPSSSSDSYWDPKRAAVQNVAITRPSHDAWGIQKIVLLFCDDFATKIYQLPWYHDFEKALQPIFDLCLPPNAGLIRLLFASLPPGVTIPVHHDTGEWVKTTHRVHVPIIAKDASRILFRCGPTSDHMQRIDCAPGHVFEINNQAKHAVSNCSADSRVHLIMDYIDAPGPDRTILDPGEELIQTRRSIDRLKDMKERPSPSYIILGAQKAGTTSLYDYINQHPWVVGARRRETHCLDWRWNSDLDDPGKELAFCQKFFFVQELKLHPSCLTGDSTPSYMLDSRRVIPRIKRIFGWKLKFFCMLRDPVKRAISHYAMVTSNKGNAAQLKTRGCEWRQLSFRSVVALELKFLDQCGLIPYFDIETGVVDQQCFDNFCGSTDEDTAWETYLANHVPLNTGSYGLLTRGMYALQLRPWFRAFDRDQFLVLKLESLRENGVQQFMAPVWEHLDLPAHPVEDEEAKNTRGYNPMGDDIRSYLERFFDPHNRRLGLLLQSSDWCEPWPYKC